MSRRGRVAAAGALTVVALVGITAAASPSRPVMSAGPLADALALSSGPELDRRRAAAVAARTATCMRAAGHPFRAWVEPPPVIPDPQLDPVAWADRWGFGVTTAIGTPPPVPIDPNLDRIAAMPAPDRIRATEALFGSDGRSGCQGQAVDAVYGLRERVLRPLRSRLTDLAARIDADPMVTRALADWRRCLAAAVPALVLRPARPGDLVALRSWLMARADASRDAGARRAVQADERRIAAAVVRCDVRLDEARRRAAAAYERGFIADHRGDLDRISAVIRRAEAAYPLDVP